MPVAQRVLGENNELMLKMRWSFAEVLCRADGATLGDTREAVAMLEDAGRIARRVLGGAHPITVGLERALRLAQAASATSSLSAPPKLSRTFKLQRELISYRYRSSGTGSCRTAACRTRCTTA